VLLKQKAFLSLGLCLGVVLTACSGNPSLEGKFSADPQLQNSPSPVTSPISSLPPEIPVYQNAELIDTPPSTIPNQILTRWKSTDPSNLIETFYIQYFQKNEWEIISPTSANELTGEIVARRNNQEAKINIESTSGQTTYLITYQDTTKAAIAPTTSTPPVTSFSPSTPTTFSDLQQIPQPLQKFVQDLGSLGIITPYRGSEFSANTIITRRQFARWLITANNTFFSNNPGKQIRLGSNTPAFQDVRINDPDFPYIQGLADAGLIPSTLRGDSDALYFRPDAPLTREDLIEWKVVLDTNQIPPASIESVKQTWGFQDVNKIEPKVLRFLYADHQNGDKANIRRVLGYTTLFQPKKPVSRSEAAAALWYFGYQGDGLSAADVLQNPNQPQAINPR